MIEIEAWLRVSRIYDQRDLIVAALVVAHGRRELAEAVKACFVGFTAHFRPWATPHRCSR
jgi:hypothetical protein